MAEEKRKAPAGSGETGILDQIDAALLGLARLRAQTGVYEYIPAARLTTRLTGIILSPTLLPVPTMAHTPDVTRALRDLVRGMIAMGAVDGHD